MFDLSNNCCFVRFEDQEDRLDNQLSRNTELLQQNEFRLNEVEVRSWHSWHILDTFLAHVLDTRSPPVRAICDFVLSVTVVILIQVLQECLLQIRGPERSDDEDDEEQESEEERKYLLMPFLATLPVFPPFPSPCVPRLSPFPPSHPLSPFFLLSCFCFLWCTSNAGCAVE